MTIAVNRNLSKCENSPKKRFSGLQLMNSINWPAPSIWVFIAQLGEHCSGNAEATGSNPVEAPKTFFSGYFRICLNYDSLRWSHTHFTLNLLNLLNRRRQNGVRRFLKKPAVFCLFVCLFVCFFVRSSPRTALGRISGMLMTHKMLRVSTAL